ncbi:hypothetical protein AAG906_011512 [Vitis piasezkii]
MWGGSRFEVSNDFMLMNPLNGAGNDQLHGLTKTLETSDSDWRIVVGFCSLAVCEGNRERIEIQLYEHLHHIFYKFGVETYFVNSAGEVVHDIVLQQRGKAAM